MMWPGDMFGQTNDDDLVTLLNVFCIELAEKKTGNNEGMTPIEFGVKGKRHQIPNDFH